MKKRKFLRYIKKMFGYIYNFLSSWSSTKEQEEVIEEKYNELERQNAIKIENCYYIYNKEKQIREWKKKAKKTLEEEIKKIKGR